MNLSKVDPQLLSNMVNKMEEATITLDKLKIPQVEKILTDAVCGPSSLKMLWLNYCPSNDPGIILQPDLVKAAKYLIPYVNVDCDDSDESDFESDESIDSEDNEEEVDDVDEVVPSCIMVNFPI